MKTIIVDLDGTIALNKHRQHFIATSPPNWNEFFLACVDDKPNPPVIETLQLYKEKNYRIHIFSARGEIAVNETVQWLERYAVPYDELTLREIGCFIPDEKLKAQWLIEKYPNFRDDIFLVLDDRQKVVDMWRAKGLTCFQVAEGSF